MLKFNVKVLKACENEPKGWEKNIRKIGVILEKVFNRVYQFVIIKKQFSPPLFSLAPLPLWPEGAPGALGDKDDDKPTLTAFLPAPETATGAAIVICPGGGYGGRTR